MELTSMFLNQLTNKSTNNMISSNKTSSGFSEVLNKAENKNYNKNNSINNKKEDNYSKNNNTLNKTNEKQPVDKENDKKYKVDNKKDITTQEKQNVKENDEDKEKVILVDEEVLNKLSEILGISTDKIMNILSSLSLSVSMLQEPENLTKFLQTAFNVETPVQLLSIDNIKDVMKNITDIAKNINYQDMISLDEDINNKIKDIITNNNLKDIKLLSSKDESIKQKIEALLEDLNGFVEESSQKVNMVQVKPKLNIENNNLPEETDQLVNVEETQNIKISNEQIGYYQNNAQNNNNQNQFLGENLKQSIDINPKQEVFNIPEISNNTKIFNASLPKTQVLKNINTTDVVAQIMEKMKISVKPEISEVKMLLKPEQLGEVSLKIATQNGIVTAQFIAESQKVKEIIEANFNQLKDMLAEQGVNVGALEVNVSTSDEQQPTYNMFEQKSEKNQRVIDGLLQDDVQIEENNIKEEHIIDSQVNYSI